VRPGFDPGRDPLVSRAGPALAAILAVLLPPATGRTQGKLDQARDQVRTPPSSGESESDEGDGQTPYDGPGGSVEDYTDVYSQSDGTADASLVGYTLGFLFYVPHLLIEGLDPRYGRFGGPPYMDGKRGRMVFSGSPWAPPPEPRSTADGDLLITPEDPAPEPMPPGASPLALAVSVEYGHDLDDLYKPAARAMVSTSFRLGIESGWTWFTEPLEDGWDWLVVGDINLIWRFAQAEAVEMYSGAGVRLMVDDVGWNAGFNFTYGFDAFPVNPLVLSASIDLGHLGWAFVVHGRGHLGVTRFGFEIFAGWDALLIGDVLFQGPLIGLRGWI